MPSTRGSVVTFRHVSQHARPESQRAPGRRVRVARVVGRRAALDIRARRRFEHRRRRGFRASRGSRCACSRAPHDELAFSSQSGAILDGDGFPGTSAGTDRRRTYQEETALKQMSGRVMTVALVGRWRRGAFAGGAHATRRRPPACLPADHDAKRRVARAADGRPARDPGVRVWHDATGWHVRVTHNALHDRVFSGEIVTTGTLIDVHAVRLEKNDYLVVGPDHHSLASGSTTTAASTASTSTRSARRTWASSSPRMATSCRPRASRSGAAVHPTHDPFVIRRTA